MPIDKETIKTLNRAGTAKIRKLAKRHDYYNALWNYVGRKTSKEYRITCRRGKYVWISWAAFGAYPPKGVSSRYTVGEFVKKFELSR